MWVAFNFLQKLKKWFFDLVFWSWIIRHWLCKALIEELWVDKITELVEHTSEPIKLFYLFFLCELLFFLLSLPSFSFSMHVFFQKSIKISHQSVDIALPIFWLRNWQKVLKLNLFEGARLELCKDFIFFISFLLFLVQLNNNWVLQCF